MTVGSGLGVYGHHKFQGRVLVGVQAAEPLEASEISHFLRPENGQGSYNFLSVLQ